ncbi:MAG: pyridoxine 5'-phosphate synthase [bacterium]|nr:pyridoxine 5'-phosphate synthase [bacterium]
MKLGVNIDHVATLRQVRRAALPDPVAAAAIAEMAGADGITVHLREDRRHIQDRDVELLLRTVTTKLNLEMSLAPEIVARACAFHPHCACLVPERREEVTTEGGLDVRGQLAAVRRVVRRLERAGVIVSLFVDPVRAQISAAAESGAPFIELHTGVFARARTEGARMRALAALQRAAAFAHECGLRVNAGHGLDYHNVHLMHQVPFVEELNIGHAIIARAVMVGLDRAVRDMAALVHGPVPMGQGAQKP